MNVLCHSSVFFIAWVEWTVRRNNTVMDGLTASSNKPSNGLRHAQSLDNVSWVSSPRQKYWPAVDEVRWLYKFSFLFFQIRSSFHSLLIGCFTNTTKIWTTTFCCIVCRWGLFYRSFPYKNLFSFFINKIKIFIFSRIVHYMVLEVNALVHHLLRMEMMA